MGAPARSRRVPRHAGEWRALLGAIALYALATLVRGERWQPLLLAEGATPTPRRHPGLNVVGYAGNNILPARAGDAMRVILMAPRAATSKKTVLGTLVAERLLDIAVILTLFVVVGYGLLGEVGGGDVGWIVLGDRRSSRSPPAVAVVLVRRNERLHALIAPILASTLGCAGRHGLTLLGHDVRDLGARGRRVDERRRRRRLRQWTRSRAATSSRWRACSR